MRRRKYRWEELFHSPEEVLRRKTVRKRDSYRKWKGWLDYLTSGERPPEEIIRNIWQMIEDRKGFGSAYNSECSLESLELLLEDAKNERESRKDKKV